MSRTPTETRHVIWSNDNLDFERDWKDDLSAQYPDHTEDELLSLMYDLNNEYLDDERVNLNITLSRPILIIADLGLWNGRRSGYAEIKSRNIRDCLYSESDYVNGLWTSWATCAATLCIMTARIICFIVCTRTPPPNPRSNVCRKSSMKERQHGRTSPD